MIRDIIQTNGAWKQTSVVLNREPVFTYDQVDNWLVAEDSGFFSFYHYEKPVGRFKAFAGREFDIPLKKGEIIKATGQWWDAVPKEYQDKVVPVGSGTVESLNKCYVFCHTYISKDIVEKWLTENEATPSPLFIYTRSHINKICLCCIYL